MRGITRIFSLLLGILAVGASLRATPIKILCLGDSITQGGNTLASYREPLIRILLGDNDLDGISGEAGEKAYTVQFVGSMSNTWGTGGDPTNPSPPNGAYPSSLAVHPNHEGHYGWRTDEILNGVLPSPYPGTGTGMLSTWLAGYDVDIALVHLGTNDALHNVDNPDAGFLTTTWTELTSVLTAVENDSAEAHLFLAEIIPIHVNGSEDFWDDAAVEVDSLRAHIVANVGTTNATLVQFPTFNTSTMITAPDRAHPNALGGENMAMEWFAAMESTLDLLQWRCDNFGTTSNTGSAADDADFDNDGHKNLLEWAVLGMDPTVPDSPNITVEVVGGYLQITVMKNPLAVDVMFSAESGGTPGGLLESNTVVIADNDTTFVARDNVMVTAGVERFIRVKVTR